MPKALDPAEAARLYRDERKSPCQIAAEHGSLTPAGVARKIREGGCSGGLTWCRVHRKYEALEQM
jgi:hypothetical protein